MKKIDHQSQIVLYAKGWFHKSEDIYEDLKILIGEAYLLNAEYISMSEIREVMITIVQDCKILKDPRMIRELFDDISPESYYKWAKEWTNRDMHRPHKDYDFTKAVIGKCLSMLNGLCMNEGGKRKFILKRPNFDLLPRSKNSTSDLDKFEWDD